MGSSLKEDAPHEGGLVAEIVTVAGRVVASRILPLGGALSGVFQTLAFAGRFEDAAVVRQPVQHGTGEPLAAEDSVSFGVSVIWGQSVICVIWGQSVSFGVRAPLDVSQALDRFATLCCFG